MWAIENGLRRGAYVLTFPFYIPMCPNIMRIHNE